MNLLPVIVREQRAQLREPMTYCSTGREGAMLLDVDLRWIDRASVIPGRSNLAGAAQ